MDVRESCHQDCVCVWCKRTKTKSNNSPNLRWRRVKAINCVFNLYIQVYDCIYACILYSVGVIVVGVAYDCHAFCSGSDSVIKRWQTNDKKYPLVALNMNKHTTKHTHTHRHTKHSIYKATAKREKETLPRH